MSKQGSNSELFVHENNTLTARPQLFGFDQTLCSEQTHHEYV